MAAWSLEGENELHHFLALVRPEWSKPRRRGHSDLARVIDKLRNIGVSDTETLVESVGRNTLNDKLTAKGFVPLSREAIEGIRKQSPFVRACHSVEAPLVRQVGCFAPAAQLLARKRLSSSQGGNRNKEHVGNSSGSSSVPNLGRSTPSRPQRATSAASSVRSGGAATCVASGGGGGAVAVDPALFGFGRPFMGPLKLRDDTLFSTRRRAPQARSLEVAISSDEDWPRSAPWPATTRAVGFGRTLSPPSEALRPSDESDGSCGLTSTLTTSLPRGGLPWLPSLQVDTSARTSASASASACEDGGSSSASPQPTRQARAATGSDDGAPLPAGVSEQEVTRLRKIGRDMRRQALAAKWLVASKLGPCEQGDEMLREQAAFDERDRLVRSSPMRTHVAHNIRCRLQSEQQRDALQGMTMQQKCLNIRKNLTSLVNLRRDVTNLRGKWQSLSGEVDEEAEEVATSIALRHVADNLRIEGAWRRTPCCPETPLRGTGLPARRTVEGKQGMPADLVQIPCSQRASSAVAV